jgi:hypothetical protein
MAASPKKPVPTTAGELFFKDYLEAAQYPYEFEKEVPGKGKRPDYTVTKNGVFLFEVKDFDPVEILLGYSSYDPYRHIREKIDECREQFKEYKKYPCSVVLWNNGHQLVHIDRPHVILGAMYGDSGFRLPIDTRTGAACGDLTRAFLGRGKMFRYGDVDNAHNTTISALITLRYVQIGSWKFDQLWKERKRVDNNFGRDNPVAASKEIYAEAENRSPSIDLDERRLGVIVWENAVARVPLSRDLFKGPYDKRWGYEDGCQKVVFQGEKLAALERGTTKK